MDSNHPFYAQYDSAERAGQSRVSMSGSNDCANQPSDIMGTAAPQSYPMSYAQNLKNAAAAPTGQMEFDAQLKPQQSQSSNKHRRSGSYHERHHPHHSANDGHHGQHHSHHSGDPANYADDHHEQHHSHHGRRHRRNSNIHRIPELGIETQHYYNQLGAIHADPVGCATPFEQAGFIDNYTTNMDGYAAATQLAPTHQLEETIGAEEPESICAQATLPPDLSLGSAEPLLNAGPPPVLVKKKLHEPAADYKQEIYIRYLKPPQLPPPGPVIIKEIRERQKSPQPPIIIRQRPKIPKTPPPLVLREKPPLPPCIPQTQVLVKRIPAPPPNPRQVIVERYPRLPPKPRDIIIEKWLPYDAVPKRKVIVHKAPPAKVCPPEKNMIVQFIGNEPNVCRTYRQLGVEQTNPEIYTTLYRNELMEPDHLRNIAAQEGILDAITGPLECTTTIQSNVCCLPGTESQFGSLQSRCCPQPSECFNVQCQPAANHQVVIRNRPASAKPSTEQMILSKGQHDCGQHC